MAELSVPRASTRLWLLQEFMGLAVWLLMTLPYVSRAGVPPPSRPSQRFLFVCNHVSLLDTLLLGGVLWRSRRMPFLVLGDKATWSRSFVRRALSRPVGFLINRGRLDSSLIDQLRSFGAASVEFNLIVFPEGTRGNGSSVGVCQPGLYHVAHEAAVPIVPVLMQNVERLSTKTGPIHLLRGLRQVEIRFGDPIDVETHSAMQCNEFLAFIRAQMESLRSRRIGDSCPVDRVRVRPPLC